MNPPGHLYRSLALHCLGLPCLVAQSTGEWGEFLEMGVPRKYYKFFMGAKVTKWRAAQKAKAAARAVPG